MGARGRGLRGLAFLSCPPGLSTPGARTAAAPSSAPRHSPRRRRRRSLPAPPPPRPPLPCQPGRQPVRAAALRPGADGKTPTAPPGGGGGVDQRVRVTGAGAGGREGGARGRRAGAGQLGPERAPPGPRRGLAKLVEESRKTWGRCWREKENLREEEEEEKPNIWRGNGILGFFSGIFKSGKVKLINIFPLPSTSEDCFLPGIMPSRLSSHTVANGKTAGMGEQEKKEMPPFIGGTLLALKILFIYLR
uniref:atherin-like n=1 Tax=Halichoerus grypus TaxID=9711 RepID=UPI0016592DCF|nr:atherin-like [Halichoerus grypus]